MNQEYVGLGIQLLGSVLAAWALVGELRSGPNIDVPGRPNDPRGRSGPRNPHTEPFKTKTPRVSGMERERHAGRRDLWGLDTPRGVPPDVAALGTWIAGVMREHRERAAADWERQQVLTAELRRADDQLRREQAAEAARMHQATRRRVVWEMFGLFLVAVGTIVATAPL